MVSNTRYKLYMQQKVHLKLYEVAASILQVIIKFCETKKKIELRFWFTLHINLCSTSHHPN